jgi:hypothetical protein
MASENVCLQNRVEILLKGGEQKEENGCLFNCLIVRDKDVTQTENKTRPKHPTGLIGNRQKLFIK